MMLHIHSMREALPVFKALGAETRVGILELLYQEGDKNMNDLARALGLTNSAISLHIGKLEEAGLVEIRTLSGKRGTMKVCKPVYDQLLADLSAPGREEQCHSHEIDVGRYVAHQARPTCGLATLEGVIGEFDDPRYFSFPQRFDAAVLWLGSGYVEYVFPNSLRAGQEARELRISFEIASEYPGYRDDFPSDIFFSLNGLSLGCWISPGDYGSRRGKLNPPWWDDRCNQFGLLKQLTVNRDGTFIDGGTKISETTLDQLDLRYDSELRFRFTAPADARNAGGLTLFGRGFGDYNQGIALKTVYE